MIYFLVLFLGGDQANHPLTNQHGLKAKITTRVVKGITKKCHLKHFPPILILSFANPARGLGWVVLESKLKSC